MSILMFIFLMMLGGTYVVTAIQLADIVTGRITNWIFRNKPEHSHSSLREFIHILIAMNFIIIFMAVGYIILINIL